MDICCCQTAHEDLSFVAGESRYLVFHLKDMNGKPYDATGCEGNFSMNDFVNWADPPLLSKPAVIERDLAIVSLRPEDTAELLDVKYEYQLSLRTKHKEAEVAAAGSVFLKRSTNKEFLLGG